MNQGARCTQMEDHVLVEWPNGWKWEHRSDGFAFRGSGPGYDYRPSLKKEQDKAARRSFNWCCFFGCHDQITKSDHAARPVAFWAICKRCNKYFG